MRKCDISKLLLVLTVITSVLLFTLRSERKYAKDYSAVDYVRVQNIIAQMRDATVEECNKYDINQDGEVTEHDAVLIRCLICELFDVYEVKKSHNKTIQQNNK